MHLLEKRQIEEIKAPMPETEKIISHSFGDTINEEAWAGIDSKFRLIVVAALRSKQLQRGARPRIEADSRRHRNTSIALEEVKRGLVPFSITPKAQKKNGRVDQPLSDE
jgi:DNA-directed RNA polymerase omega subunit